MSAFHCYFFLGAFEGVVEDFLGKLNGDDRLVKEANALSRVNEPSNSRTFESILVARKIATSCEAEFFLPQPFSE